MLMAALGANAQQLTLQLDKAQKAVSPTLYGIMTEEINYSYEGGLYAQLLRDPSFREDANGKRRNPWTPWHSGGPKYWLATDTLASQLTQGRIQPRQSCRAAMEGQSRSKHCQRRVLGRAHPRERTL